MNATTLFYICWSICWLPELVCFYAWIASVRSARKGSVFPKIFFSVLVLISVFLVGTYCLNQAGHIFWANSLVVVLALLVLGYITVFLMVNMKSWKK